MRQRTRARRGGGIPPTKYHAADDGCSAREESRFSPKGETNACVVSPAPEGAKRGHGRGRSRADRSRGRRVVQDSPPTAYMYTPSGRKDAVIGRLSRASTVAPTVTAHWKANQHEATTARHRIFHTKRRGDRLEKNWGKGGATDWDRTSNLRLRRPTLYPIELQSRWSSIIPNITAPRCRFFARAPP